MKHFLREFLPLVLVLALLCALAPGALSEDETPSVTLSSSSLRIFLGKSETLTATYTPESSGGPGELSGDDAPPVTPTWTFDVTEGKDIVTLSTTGGRPGISVTVTGEKVGISVNSLRVGSAIITVSAPDGKKYECTVTVYTIAAESVTLDRTTLTLTAGTTTTLTATVKPDDTTDPTVKWSVPVGSDIVSLSSDTGPSVTVTARKAGSVTVTATSGAVYKTCTVTVTAAKISASPVNGRVDFSGLVSTLSTYCRNITGSPLSYLANISVNTAAGTLYEDYVSEADPGEGVSSALKYYNASTGACQLSKITFIPRPGFTGNATITFTAYAESGGVFTGSIVVSIDGDALSYTSEDGKAVRFQAADFTNYSQTAGHSAIKYVRFYELPSAGYGTLYYNYIDSDINEGTVSSTTLYYRTGAPYLDKVWFVPNSGFSGNVRIYFEACDTSGYTFRGSVLVQVVNVAGSTSGSSLSYSVRPGESVYLNTNDFHNLSYERTNYPLRDLYFTSLPASRNGALYCSGYGSVSTSQSFYPSGSNRRLVSNVYFTAASGYTGTVSIPFTAYATNGQRFLGTVWITVSTSAGATAPSTGQDTIYDTGSMITYSSGGEAVTFRSQDFYDNASRQLSGTLSTVEFYTPEVSQGRLCLNYGSPTSYSILSSSTTYPASMLSQISFLPRAGFSGAAYIRFIAADQSGKSYTGTLAINVTPPSASSYFDDMYGYSWAAPSADFLAHYGIVNGTNYRTYSPAGLTKRGDFVLMLQRCFNFQSVGDFAVFADVPVWSYYGPAIAGAYAAGLAAGDGDGNFRPTAALTRQEAAVLLYRCMGRSGSLPGVTMADLEGFADRGLIAPYAMTAMATLVRLGVLTGSGGLLNPTQFLTRAEMALMFHRALT